MTCYRTGSPSHRAIRKVLVERFERTGKFASMEEAADLVAQLPHDGDGMTFICGDADDFGPQCRQCGDFSDVLCDFPVAEGKTCDAPLCERCTPETAPNVHYCPGHRAEFEAFREAGGVKDKLENLVPFARQPPRWTKPRR